MLQAVLAFPPADVRRLKLPSFADRFGVPTDDAIPDGLGFDRREFDLSGPPDPVVPVVADDVRREVDVVAG